MTLGPLEYTVIGFDRPDFQGEIAAEIQTVVDKRIIRVVDVGVVTVTRLTPTGCAQVDHGSRTKEETR